MHSFHHGKILLVFAHTDVRHMIANACVSPEKDICASGSIHYPLSESVSSQVVPIFLKLWGGEKIRNTMIVKPHLE